MPITPVTCPKQPLSRDLDVEVFISRPQTELATDMTMIAVLTPDVSFSDGGNDRVRFYTTLSSLVGDVPLNSAAYWAGQAFFARSVRPSAMCVGQVFTAPTPAVLKGGKVSVPALKSIANGSFNIEVDGELVRVADLDFTGASTIKDVATVVSGKTPGMQCAANLNTNSLMIKTNNVGDGAHLSYATPSFASPGHVSVLTSYDRGILDDISDGVLTVNYDGKSYTATGMAFDASMFNSDYAAVIQAAIRKAGLTTARVTCGDTCNYIWVEGASSGSGFAPCTPATGGTDLSVILQMDAAHSPGIQNYLETNTAVPSKLVSGASLDFPAISRLQGFSLCGIHYNIVFSGVTDLANLVTACNTAAQFANDYVASEDAGKLVFTGKPGVAITDMHDEIGAAMRMDKAQCTSVQPVPVPAFAGAGTDVSALLALNEALASSNTPGYTPGSLVSEAALVSIAARCTGKSIYGWILDAKYRDTADQKAFADWCEAREPSIFLACTNSPQAYNTADASNIGAYCYMNGYKRSGVIYHNNPQVYPDMSYLACALSVNYAQQDSSLTMKFKQLDGIEPSPLTNTQLIALQSRNINSYVFIGNTSREVREGTQSLDTWFTDSLVNLDNFKEEVQVEVYNVFLRSKKVPYTQAGQNMLVSAAAKICARYTRNGVFAPRDIETTSNETGFETLPSTNIQPAPITGATASDRAQRLAPPIQITAYEAGAFHKVTLNVSVFN